jgi:hypothetical protein
VLPRKALPLDWETLLEICEEGAKDKVHFLSQESVGDILADHGSGIAVGGPVCIGDELILALASTTSLYE